MAWFARDHTRRSLTDAEVRFVSELAELLRVVGPAQLDENETSLTAEGAGLLIALMPHRSLGGLSLVASVSVQHDAGAVSWSQISDLSYHDELDLGVSVGHFRLAKGRPDFGEVISCVRSQLMAAITLRVYGPDQAEVLIRNSRGALRRLGHLGRRVGWLQRMRPARPPDDVLVRLTDSTSPPVTKPSGVGNWFHYERMGA